ncbi:hypothetical protein JZ751_014923 [Albula glossodonta]|uniref:Uncharacterized protein n=1 Tax=Albula glossodonta TaxID=121402 RepID=A0A8T2MY12_9TELE|nr:hypothetical protein JZ751_014923 [Albula glossodonta]
MRETSRHLGVKASKPEKDTAMLRAVILVGLFALHCQQVMVTAHLLSRTYSANDIARLKSLLEQFEETLAGEEAADNAVDYEDAKPEEAEQSEASPEWGRDRGGQESVSDSKGPEEGYQAQRSRLQDLLMSTRSKFPSSCFGSRIDRIGTYSGLGCTKKKG